MHRFNHPSFKPLCAPVCRRDESIGGVDRLWSRAKNGIGRRDLVGMNQGLAVKTKIMTLATFRDEAFLIVQPVINTVEHCLPMQARSEEHTSELQSLMRISYAVLCLKKKKT